MRAHPVTPMTESDLALHLARQAPLAIAKLGYPTLDGGDAAIDASLAGCAAPGRTRSCSTPAALRI